MPNGKGTIDCCYCKHYGGPHGYPDGFGLSVQCQYHGVVLPLHTPDDLNRICCHLEPDESYWRHNSFWCPPARRFAWFARDLKPGVLYFFGYNTPDKIEHQVVMREPDYQERRWKT